MATKFSVVTPTRNALHKLKRCVGSVRGQTGAAVEHLVQDACSSDGTPGWLAAQPDLLARSEPDSGMYDAINRGWERSSGNILSWLNSDEQYLPGTLERVARVFANNPAVDFIYGDALVVDAEGNLLAARREIRLSRTYIANGFLNAFSCTTFFRRRLHDAGVLPLDTRYRYAADMDLVLRLLESGIRYRKVDAYLSVFTVDGTNLSCHPEMLAEVGDIQRRFGPFVRPCCARRRPLVANSSVCSRVPTAGSTCATRSRRMNGPLTGPSPAVASPEPIARADAMIRRSPAAHASLPVRLAFLRTSGR